MRDGTPGRGRTERPRRRPWIGAIKAALLVGFLLLVTAVVMLAPSSAPPPLTDAQRQEGLRNIGDAKRALEAVRSEAKAGRRHESTIELSEWDLTAFLQIDPEAQRVLRSHSIDHAWVEIRDRRLEVNASRAVGGLRVTGKAIVTPFPDPDHSLGLRLDGIKLGRLGLPQSVEERARAAAITSLEAVRQLFADVKVLSVEPSDGKLVLVVSSETG